MIDAEQVKGLVERIRGIADPEIVTALTSLLAEVERLTEAKRRALQVADERAKEAIAATQQAAEMRAATIEECAKIVDAIDSGRGNEKHIAKCIRALSADSASAENDADLPTANDVRGILSQSGEKG